MLGIAIRQDHATGRVELDQRQYIHDQLACFGMADCSKVTTPMTAGLCLTKPDAAQLDAEHNFMANVPYASAVGALLNLVMCTRPDISYSISVLFIAYSDADHACSVDTGRLTGSYMLITAGAVISWQSKLQSLVTLSTTEAQYIAAVETGKDVMWMHQLLGEFGLRVSGTTKLHVKNQSAISVTCNLEHHGRMKHLDLCYYWLCDIVETGVISPVFVPTHMQVAEIFTKALPHVDIKHYCGMLGLSA